MFALYWPVMALVAGLVIIVSALSISMSRLCRVRMEPLPERDLNTYLPEDVSFIMDFLCLGIVKGYVLVPAKIFYHAKLHQQFSTLV